MTISTTTSRKSFTGAGTTGPFAFPYTLLAQADLVVLSVNNATGVSTLLVLNTDYTLAGSADSVGRYVAGANISTTVAVAAGTTLVAYTDPALTQTLDLVENDPLPAEQIEKAFDHDVLLEQRTRDLQLRSLHLPDSDSSGVSMELPGVTVRASSFLGFDSTGAPVAYAGVPSAIVSSAMAPVVSAASLVAARAAMGTVPGSNNFARTDAGNTFAGAQIVTGNFTVQKTLPIIAASSNGANGDSAQFTWTSKTAGGASTVWTVGTNITGTSNELEEYNNTAAITARAMKTNGQVILNNGVTPLFGAWETINYNGGTFSGIALNDGASASGGTFAVFGINGVQIGGIQRNAATSAVLFNTTSDYRIKDLVGPYTGALALVDQLVVHDGSFNGSTLRQPLLIAHEVQAVTPWCVTGEKDAENEDGTPKYQQLATGGHEALLIAAVQELMAQNAALTARVATLEARP